MNHIKCKSDHYHEYMVSYSLIITLFIYIVDNPKNMLYENNEDNCHYQIVYGQVNGPMCGF
jgi:hypothetical protein